MIKVKREQMNHIAHLFKEFEDSMVISCLQGHMGNAYAETPDHPKAALIVSGEYSFFAGGANSEDAVIICTREQPGSRPPIWYRANGL